MINKTNEGQSLFEVILAMFIITLIIVAVVLLSTSSVSNSLASKRNTQAVRYTQESIEWLRNERENNPSSFITHASTTNYCLVTLDFSNTGVCQSTELIDSLFKRDLEFTISVVNISGEDKNLVTATVVTSWTDTHGYHEARSSTSFSDIRESE